MKGLLTLISGSSGVGKNTVIAKLIEENSDLKMLRSCTSRGIRVDDKVQADGKYAYDFVTKDVFEEKLNNGEILEYDEFSGNYYGISKDSVNEVLKQGKIGIKDITVKGVVSCKEKLPKSVDIVSVFMTLEKSKLKQRLKLRQTKDIKNRMKHYAFEQKSISLYDFCVLNEDLDSTLSKMRAILEYGKGREIRVGENLSKYSLDKVEKLVKKLKRNDKVKPIEVMEQDGYIYIVKGYHTYLASIKSGMSVTKKFVDNKKIIESDQEYFKDLVNSMR